MNTSHLLEPDTQETVKAWSNSTNTSGIDVVENLSLRDFIRKYRTPRKPVLIKDATKLWQARSWTPELFQNKVGHKTVSIRTNTGTITRNFGELLKEIIHSSESQPAEYARNIDVEHMLPELWWDIKPRISYAQRDWKSSWPNSKDLVFPNHLEELFVGGKGASFPKLHVDYYGMDGFVSQLYGRKEFYLISPGETKFVYPDPQDPLTSQIPNLHAVDETQFPLFKHAKLIKLILEPGDTLYNPNGWWHTSYMPETSITVITATWHRDNWLEFMKQYLARSRQSKPKKLLSLTRQALAAGVLRLRELFV